MEFVQTHFPFSEVTSNKSSNISKGNGTFLYVSLMIFLIGGGVYAYYMLPMKIKHNENYL